MKHLILAGALLLAACDLKVKTKEPSVPVPPAKPTCARGLTKEIPQAFQMAGRAVGAVKTESCETLVIGHDNAGAVIVGRYDTTGAPMDVLKPLEPRYADRNVRIQRVAVINDGFFAFGLHARQGEMNALFAMRLLDSGFLDLAYGPLHDGVARAQPDGRYDLLKIDSVSVDGDLIRLRVRADDGLSGTQTDLDQVLPLSGAQGMEKDLRPVPASCELLNHSAVVERTTVQIAQSGCGQMSFRTSGALGTDALTIAMDGTTYFSNVLGDMRWYYEGTQPILASRDTRGFVKREYVAFVQGKRPFAGPRWRPAGVISSLARSHRRRPAGSRIAGLCKLRGGRYVRKHE